MTALDRRAVLGGMSATAVAATAVAGPDPDGSPRIMQGPMIGYVTTDVAAIWLRVSAPVTTQIEYAFPDKPHDWLRSEIITAMRETDFTVVHQLKGLKPGQDIHYRVLVNGALDPEILGKPASVFKTAPQRATAFRVGFGSCARVQRQPVQPIWDALTRMNPDLFFWLGDNIYGDSLESTILAEEYRRQRDVVNLKPFMATVPQLAIWDDHDYGLNDHDRTNPIRDDALRVFKNYWANPGYGLPQTAGVFFKYTYGGVDFFFLDNRYHRDPVDQLDDLNKTTLGQAQREWLFDGLKASRTPFKMILAGQPWNDGKLPGGESWSSFVTERKMLLDHIQQNKISGVVLASGDTHVGELNVLQNEAYGAGYDIYEFVSSPLAQDTASSWLNYRAIPRIRQVYARSSNAGVIDFDMTLSDPALRFTLIDTLGNPAWSPFEIKASDLKPGVTSWRAKMDKVSAARWAAAEKGQPYYGLAE
jgi:alkaline phosphatase D